METVTKKLQGGEFLIKESEVQGTFTPEDLTEEQKMFGTSAREFVETRVGPNVEKIDAQEDPTLVPTLLEEAGQLGILGMTLPEEYGGMGESIATDTVLADELGQANSFGVAVAAHTGIGTLPILYYGTEAQKQHYLPKLATGEWKAAYCLTEPGSGSDALGAKTKAVLNDAGTHYIINGQKMWITNGGFADVFTVFAQIDGDKFTGFVVDANTPGITLGAEEKKLGIKGSSTRQVFFENCEVPKENILGEIGKGHKIAFNVLNIGRYKLCAMVMGGAKKSVTYATKYANERIQFKTSISSFGAIQHKLAEMAIKTYVCEAATYRAAGLIDERIEELAAEGVDKVEAKLQAAEEYSVECAILKVFGSEVVDYCVDEAVQVYGGTGFSEEFPVARAYRDARINRIFEGTNEINRLLSVGMLVRKALKGEIDLLGPAKAVQKELTSVPSFGGAAATGALAKEFKTVKECKKAILMAAGAAVQKYGEKLEKEQEVIMEIADMLIELFACESALLRTQKMIDTKGEDAAAIYIEMTRTYVSDAVERINISGKHAVAAIADGDMAKMMLMGLKRFTKLDPFNTIAARRKVAAQLIEANEYCF